MSASSDQTVIELLRLLPLLRDTPTHLLRCSYDAEADVLYVSLGEPREADDSDLDERGVLTRFAGGEIIGYTILNASKLGAKAA
ncbi:DUF2283 domain-containing protein [bacterium]|nr:DUF2283 domain-containing protein [bacterium]